MSSIPIRFHLVRLEYQPISGANLGDFLFSPVKNGCIRSAAYFSARQTPFQPISDRLGDAPVANHNGSNHFIHYRTNTISTAVTAAC
jgi:hypothetical protein